MTGSPVVSPGWYLNAQGVQQWWDGSRWGPIAPPVYASAPNVTAASRIHPVEGFVCGLIGLVLVSIPILNLALGITGWVFCAKALRVLRSGEKGRGLAVAGLVLSIVAVGLTPLFTFTAFFGTDWIG